MAGGYVALDALAEDVGVAFGEAEVTDAGVEVRGWADGVVAGREGALRDHEDAAVVGFLEDLLLLLRADRAVVFGAVVAASHLGRFPRRAEGGHIGGVVAIGEEMIVFMLPVVVATEPTEVALVALGGCDPHVVEEVVVYNEAEVGLKEDARPMLVHLDLSLVQDGREVVEYGVHLGRREKSHGEASGREATGVGAKKTSGETPSNQCFYEFMAPSLQLEGEVGMKMAFC